VAPESLFGSLRVTKTPTLRDQVYDLLSREIQEYRLKPGDRLVEAKLAEELGISRGPIREAVARLIAEGLLIDGQGSGVYVAPLPSVKEIEDNYLIRGLLQSLAARLAATNITKLELEQLTACLESAKKYIAQGEAEVFFEHNLEFHRIIEKAACSERLEDVINYLRSPFYLRVSHKLPQIHRLGVALDEHQAILQALIQADGEAAERLMKTHLENAKWSLLDKLKEEEDA